MTGLVAEFLRRRVVEMSHRLQECAAAYERELFERELAAARRAARAAKRRAGGKIARRLELLDWIADVGNGRASGPCQGFEVGHARRVLKSSTGGDAAVAAKLTGEPVERYREAQRERRRLGNRRR